MIQYPLPGLWNPERLIQVMDLKIIQCLGVGLLSISMPARVVGPTFTSFKGKCTKSWVLGIGKDTVESSPCGFLTLDSIPLDLTRCFLLLLVKKCSTLLWLLSPKPSGYFNLWALDPGAQTPSLPSGCSSPHPHQQLQKVRTSAFPSFLSCSTVKAVSKTSFRPLSNSVGVP